MRARRLVVTGILAVLVATSACTQPTTAPAPASSTLFGNDDCLNRVDQMMSDTPGLYTSRQDAYDSCRDAQKLLGEIKGSVTTQP